MHETTIDDNTHEIHADSYATPLARRKADVSHITEESVKAELEALHAIIIPSRKSMFRTPELTAKREILMKMVYRGEISIDCSSSEGEVAMVFFNVKPKL
jgi:hypothetical protein